MKYILKKIKKSLSAICVAAIVFSCLISTLSASAATTTVEIVFNNNGSLAADTLEIGATLPTPVSEIEGNRFLGWYSDYNWTTKVDSVPEESTTLYAKWSTIVIDFNQIATNDMVNFATAGGARAVTNGVASCTLRTTHYFTVPAYDAKGVNTFFELEDGKNYEITVSYKLNKKLASAARYFYYGLCDGKNTRGAVTQICAVPTEDMTAFEDYTINLQNFTATSGQNNIYFRQLSYEAGVTYFDKIIISEVAPKQVVTLNNNGTITTASLEEGAALPVPTSDIDGNEFLGWYTDTTWTTKVETAPATATTLYAKWTKIVIDFNNMLVSDLLVTASTKSLSDGVATVRLRANHYFNIPAYDAAGAGSYVVKDRVKYRVTFVYKSKSVSHSSAQRNVYVGLDDGSARGSAKAAFMLPSADMTEFEEVSYTFTAYVDDNKNRLYICNNMYFAGDISFDKIIIEEISSKIALKEGVWASSVRDEDSEGEAYKSAGIRFRARISAEKAALASKIGFILVPDGYGVDSSFAVNAVNKDMEANIDIVYSTETANYVDYQVILTGLTREDENKNLKNLKIDVYFYYVIDDETKMIGETYEDSYSAVKERLEANNGLKWKIATTTADFSGASGFETNEQVLRGLYDAGFQYIDFSMYNFTQDCVWMQDNWREEALKLKALADELGMTFVQAHSQGGNPLSTDEQEAEFIVAATIRSLEICEVLGIENTVVHAGYGVFTKEEWFAKNKEFYDKLLPTAERCGVNILTENSTSKNIGSKYYINNADDMLEFIKYVDHPNFHACWDTGHSNCETISSRQYDEILTLGDELYAIHYADNMGDGDTHLMPYFGTLDPYWIVKALVDVGFEGYFTLECDGGSRAATEYTGPEFPGMTEAFPNTEIKDIPKKMTREQQEALLYKITEYIVKTFTSDK